jgi:Icc-related predicted phosphoesterase
MTNLEPPTQAKNQPIKKTRRLVLMSDTHDRHGQFDVPEGDILLHAGDFTFNGQQAELERFNSWLGTLNFQHKVIIPGNHDLTFETDWKWATHHVPEADAILNGELYEVDGLKIWGEPRQPWFWDWAFNVPRGPEMKKVWEKVPTDIDVLLTHGPPLGAGDLTLLRNNLPGSHVGCEAQREWIIEHQPKLVVCGHIHPGYGLHMIGNTLVVNASVCNEQYRPVNKPVVLHV